MFSGGAPAPAPRQRAGNEDLSRYLVKEVATSLLVLAALLMLWVFYDLLAELGSLRALNAAQFLVLVAATIPRSSLRTAAGGCPDRYLFALAQLASNSEYGVMRTSGVSVFAGGDGAVRRQSGCRRARCS